MFCPKLFLLLTLLGPALGYNILVISTVPSRSHNTLAKGVVTSLLDAGHKVTSVSAYTDWASHKNLKLIEVNDTLKLISKDLDMTKEKNRDMSFVQEFAANISRVTSSNKQLREILVKENFDAVVTESFFSDIEAGYAAVQQAPWIVLLGMPLHPHMEGLVHDVHSVTTVPIVMLDFPSPLSFWHRVVNFATYVMMCVQTKLKEPETASRYESYFGDLAKARGVKLPPFQDALYNISILFVNSHPSVAPALSLPPNVIDIGGYHIDEVKPLPQDLQAIIDSASCIIFFSMGSVVKGSLLPVALRKELIDVFETQPCTVLWKFEEELKGLKNIVVRKWWPQASLLADPKVKVFITHGGMLSTLEAVKNGVPLLAVPVFGDQPANAARAARDGYAVTVPFNVDMAPKIKEALQELLSNDRYYKTVQFLSKIFNKRPVPPRKLVSHYVELAIESRGAFHLRSKTHNYRWYERFMVDAAALVVAILCGLYLVLRRVLCSKSRENKIKKN